MTACVGSGHNVEVNVVYRVLNLWLQRIRRVSVDGIFEAPPASVTSLAAHFDNPHVFSDKRPRHSTGWTVPYCTGFLAGDKRSLSVHVCGLLQRLYDKNDSEYGESQKEKKSSELSFVS